MQVNRKDTILVAVLVNVGLLAVLFITSLSSDEPEFRQVAAAPEPAVPIEVVTAPPALESESPHIVPLDEVDQVLQEFAAAQNSAPQEVKRVQKDPKQNTIEITVKRGDALDKIARHNRTTAKEIKRINNLSSDRLQIGQVLKIPLPDPEAVAMKQETPSKESKEVWYEVQSGDNPWKIAKKFHVSYSQLLKLNNLDEASARSMRPGHKVRIQ